MARSRTGARRRPPDLLAGSLLVLLVLGPVSWVLSPPAAADVTAATGSAHGYVSEVSLFGGPPSQRGPEPVVELAADASNSPQEASVAEASAVYGPAEVFRSGRIEVSTEGSLGSDGSVTSSAQIEGHPARDERPGPLVYDRLSSTCTADEDGVSASATVTGGTVETSYDPETQEPATTEEVPEQPPPGHTVEGTLDHVGDRFRVVFNEQTTDADGSITVNAAHLYLLGPIAVGEVILGRSVCGTTAIAAGPTTSPTPTASPTPAVTVRSPSPTTPVNGPDGRPVSWASWPLAVVVLTAVAGSAAFLWTRRRSVG